MPPRSSPPGALAAPVSARPASTEPGPALDRRHGPGLRPILVAVAAVALIVILGGTEHSLLESSVTTLRHVRLRWLAAAVVAEGVSLGSIATAHRRLLRVGGVRIGPGSAVAVIYASNAISGSVPVAGSELGTAYTFHQYERRGADRLLAAWTVAVAGLVSSIMFALIIAVSVALSGNPVAAVLGSVGTLALLGGIVVLLVALRRARTLLRLLAIAVAGLRALQRVAHRPVGDPEILVRRAVEQAVGLRLRPPDWVLVVLGSSLNWLADITCLVLALKALGQPVPWDVLVPAWGAGATASSLSLTPGGLGVVEAALTAALVAAGLHSGAALDSVLLYRVITFWLALAIGWTLLLSQRRMLRLPSLGEEQPPFAVGVSAPEGVPRESRPIRPRLSASTAQRSRCHGKRPAQRLAPRRRGGAEKVEGIQTC